MQGERQLRPIDKSMQPKNTALSAGIQRYFEIALYLLVLTGFVTLAATGGLGGIPVMAVGGALLFRGYLLVKRETLLIPQSWTTILTLSYVAFYFTDYFLLSRSFIGATVHLVLFVMVVRLFSAQRDRDYYFLGVISFLMVLAAAVLTVHGAFLVAFAGFLLMAIVTFMLMEMRQASGKASIPANSASEQLANHRLALSLAGISPVLVILILVSAAGIFVILPRASSGYLSAYAAGDEIATGFSDRVQLGSIGEIQQSNALVMHIQIDGDTQGGYDLKWRGVTLNVFDGKTWFNPHEQHLLQRLSDGRFAFTEMYRTERLSFTHTVTYHVLMEPLANNVFFLAATPKTLEGNYRAVTIDDGDAVLDVDPEHPIGRYEATSEIAQPSATQLRAASQDFPPAILLSYLQLPDLDPRIPRLAQEITRAADNNYDKAVALEQYLRTNFRYTLQLPPAVPRDPLANFLFDRKQGHCEYFASAMAVMLRTLRIPSRVVNGFRTGEFNDVTSQYVVRARNAHSWVEAYFPGYGWISFDPTPASPAQVHGGWDRTMLYVDAMASFWREWVIDYDVVHQRALGQQFGRNSLQWYQGVRAWAQRRYDAWLADARDAQQSISGSPIRWSLAGVAAAAVLLLAANGGRLWRMLRRRQIAAHPSESPSRAASIWYEKMIRLLARRGFQKSAFQTPEEFVALVQKSALHFHVARFTKSYVNARFGGSAFDAEQLPELYKQVRNAEQR
jgi:protein-glutamine gamma-glutamyltransferase